MSGVSCPMPKVVTYADTRAMYNKVRKEMPELPGVSGHRREAARRLGLDYKTYMDVFTKRIADSSGGATRLAPKAAVAKSPKVKAPKSLYREVVGENEFGQPTTEMFWGRKKLGEVSEIEHEYIGGATRIQYVARIGNKSEAFTRTDTFNEARHLVAGRGAFDMDITKQTTELLDRLADVTGDINIDGLVKLGRTNFDTAKADAGARASLSMEHQKQVFDELEDQFKYSGDYASEYFHGMHKYDGSDEIAHYRTFEHSMTVNPMYGKMEVKRLDDLHHGGEVNRFYTQTASTEYGGGMKSVIAHEYGHHVQSIIDNYVAVTKMPDISVRTLSTTETADYIEQFIRWRTETSAARVVASQMYDDIITIILRDMNIRDPSLYSRARNSDKMWDTAVKSDKSLDYFIKEAVQTSWNPGPGSRMFPADSGRGTPAFFVGDSWLNYMSGYGATNGHEMMAEVWAEYSRNRAVRPHIREMGAAIQTTLTKLERLRKVVTQ